MTTLCPLVPPDLWLYQLFSARAAREGGIVRRQIRDVERIIGRAAELCREMGDGV